MATAGFSTAADWLSNISGPNAEQQISKVDESKDPILRDLRSMKDAETKANAASAPKYVDPPRNDARAHNAAHTTALRQPKPKFVAHKDPTKGKGRKDKKGSNRLG
eukprot:98374_1